MKPRGNQYILSLIEEGGEEKLDIRFWKATPTGGMPTNEALVIHRKEIVPLIIGLQAMYRIDSRKKALGKKTEVTQG
jgi:hypothetical protein